MDLQSVEHKIASLKVKSIFSTKEGIRVTSIFEEPYVLKHFLPGKKHKNEWVVEHNTISYLSKLNIFVPKSYGYRVDEFGAFLYKEYVPGQLIESYKKDLLEQLAQMFVDFHQNNVITRDAHNENVVLTDNNKLVFIDFGKAAIFNKKSSRYWFSLLREHFFIKSKIIKDKEDYITFLQFYLDKLPVKKKLVLKSFIISGNNILQLRDKLRGNYRHK